MALLLVKRLIALALTLAVATLVVFVVMEVLPGDPAALMLGVNARPDTLAALRAELRLDQPVTLRYLAWVGGLLRGDFGQSYTYSVPVGQLIAERVALSLPLALIAIALSTALAIPLGVLAAARRGRASDLGVMGFAQLGVAVPNFWFAILLILVFAVQLGWLPSGGFPGWRAGVWPALQSLVLPAVALWIPFFVFVVLIGWMYHVLAHRPGGQPIGALEVGAARIGKAVRRIQPKRRMPA